MVFTNALEGGNKFIFNEPPANTSPDITQKYGLADEGIADEWRAPTWWDDPNTANDEWKEFIYNQAGGETGTNLTMEQFFRDEWHGGSFPEWDESGQKTKYENVLTKIEMLNDKTQRKAAEHHFDLEALGMQYESALDKYKNQQELQSVQLDQQFMTSGGAASGRALSAIRNANKGLKQALTLESRNINLNRDALELAYEETLAELEDDEMDFTDTLIDIEDEYEQKLVSLIDTMNIEPISDEERILLDQQDNCAACIDNCYGDTPCIEDCESSPICSEGRSGVSSMRDEGNSPPGAQGGGS